MNSNFTIIGYTFSFIYSIVNRALYVYNNSSSRTPAVRNAPVTGSVIGSIPAFTKVRITEVLSGVQSDGYQWVRVSFGTTNGFVQLDLLSWLYLTE